MRIVYLTSHPDGWNPQQWLEQQPNAKVVFSYNSLVLGSNTNIFPTNLPEYDLGISFLYHFKIPESELTPNHKWINFHPARLPEYRGRNLAYHAIMNEERYFGATCHYIDSTFDTGDIIDTSQFPIGDGDTAGEIAKRAREHCEKLFYGNVTMFLQGRDIISYKQGAGTYYKREPIDPYIELDRRGKKQIRAITASPYYARINIGGKIYVVVPASEFHHSNDESSRLVATDPNPSV